MYHLGIMIKTQIARTALVDSKQLTRRERQVVSASRQVAVGIVMLMSVNRHLSLWRGLQESNKSSAGANNG